MGAGVKLMGYSTTESSAGGSVDARRHELESFLRAKIRPDSPFKWNAINSALVSTMSDRDYRLFCFYVAHARDDGTNCFVSHKRAALLLHRREDATQKAAKSLEKSGWVDVQRQRQDAALRTVKIPDQALLKIATEALDRMSGASQEAAKSPPLNHQEQAKSIVLDPLRTSEIHCSKSENNDFGRLRTMDLGGSIHKEETEEERESVAAPLAPGGVVVNCASIT